jgi:hypothetical protein
MKKEQLLVLFLLIAVAACNNATDKDKVVVKDSAVNTFKTDSSLNYIHSFADTALEDKIQTALLKLPFVIKSNNYIDSFSNHKHSIAFLMDEPEANETDIPVQAGYNGNERFETYYRFFVNPKTLEIKVYDAAADKKLTVKQYLKTQQ